MFLLIIYYKWWYQWINKRLLSADNISSLINQWDSVNYMTKTLKFSYCPPCTLYSSASQGDSDHSAAALRRSSAVANTVVFLLCTQHLKALKLLVTLPHWEWCSVPRVSHQPGDTYSRGENCTQKGQQGEIQNTPAGHNSPDLKLCPVRTMITII